MTNPVLNGIQRSAQQYSQWIQSLNSGEQNATPRDSSGILSQIQGDLANVLQQTLNIPVEQLQIEFIDGINQNSTSRETSVNTLITGSTLMLVPSESVQNENDTCAICRAMYVENDIIRKLNSCEHFFHATLCRRMV